MAWSVQGNIKGPKGDTGDRGPKGDTGEDGAGIQISGSVATYGDLPTGLDSAAVGQGYLVESDGLLYIWSGTAFPASGNGVAFRGPKGNPGDDGAAATIAAGNATSTAPGSSPTVTNTGTAQNAVFAFGIPQGAKGNAGADGAAWFDGTGAPGSVAGANPGDYYLDTDTGDVYRLS